VGGEHLDLERGAVRLRADRVLARRARVRLGPGRGRGEGEGPAAAAHTRVFGPVGRGRLARLLVLGTFFDNYGETLWFLPKSVPDGRPFGRLGYPKNNCGAADSGERTIL
jgi:hypothetical protein